jgi:hypothetical protein
LAKKKLSPNLYSKLALNNLKYIIKLHIIVDKGLQSVIGQFKTIKKTFNNSLKDKQHTIELPSTLSNLYNSEKSIKEDKLSVTE